MGDRDESWTDARAAVPRALMPSEESEQVERLLDRAAGEASAGRLRVAAGHLEDARRTMVGRNVFDRWDKGIWWFVGVIRLVRSMSPEPAVPTEFQRFLDAIPSARYEDDMSRPQLAFWYGESHERYRKAQEKHMQRGEVLMSAIVVVVIAAVIIYFTRS